MNKGIAILFVLILFGGALGYYWFFYEKPQQDLIQERVNVSVSAFEELTPDKRIVVEYKISGDGFSFEKTGKTLSKGAILEELPFNKSFKVTAFSTTGNFYPYHSNFNTFSRENKQIRIELEKPAQLTLNSQNTLQDKNLSLMIKQVTNGVYKNPIICVEESFHILNTNLEEKYQKVEKPSNYSNFDDCFDLNITFSKFNQEVKVEFNYKNWASLDFDDHIKVAIIDRERISGEFVFELNGQDIGGKDYLMTFKY